MLYVFEDSQIVDRFCELGIPILRTGYGNDSKFAVMKTPEVDEIIHKNFANVHLAVSDVLCF